MVLGINFDSFRRSGTGFVFSQLCFCGLSALLGVVEEPGHSHDQSDYRRALSYFSHRPPSDSFCQTWLRFSQFRYSPEISRWNVRMRSLPKKRSSQNSGVNGRSESNAKRIYPKLERREKMRPRCVSTSDHKQER